jgi:hypothetical protein
MSEKKPGGITGKGFVKGDKRINRKGRPRNFDALRALAQEIAHEQASDGDNITVVESVLRRWSTSSDPKLSMAFIEYAYGKVPQATEISGKDGDSIRFTISDWRKQVETARAQVAGVLTDFDE